MAGAEEFGYRRRSGTSIRGDTTQRDLNPRPNGRVEGRRRSLQIGWNFTHSFVSIQSGIAGVIVPRVR